MSTGCESKDSYEWLKQVRHYYNNVEHAYVEYLNVPVTYGYEFVCQASNPMLATTLNENQIVSLVNTLLCCNNTPILDKSFMEELSIYNAKPYVKACVPTSQNFNLL
jgi:hypothetical protein